MKIRFTSMLAALVLIVFSCSGFGCKSAALLSDAPTPKIAIANLHAADAIAQNIGADYVESPLCTSPVTVVPCSKANISAKVKDAGAKAKIAVDAADRAVHDNPNVGQSNAAGVIADAKAALEILTTLETLQVFLDTVKPATVTAAKETQAKVAAVRVDPAAYAAAKAKLAQ